MPRYMQRLLLIPLLSLMMVAGCTDRGTNVPNDSESESGIWTNREGHDFIQELLLQIGRNATISDGPRIPLRIRMYVPEGSIPWPHGTEVKPVPLLVLLPPQNSNVFYFFNHGLKQMADELIADGTIMPMAIACVENDPVFGGYFYAGRSAPAGYYDDLIGDALLDHLYAWNNFLYDSLPVGIGGVGMGGYGAFRAAMLHPGVFSSISTTDGPLDFDGPSGNGGFVPLFDDALMEQGLLGAAGWRTEFDSSGAWPLTELFIGGALAFSPHDTLVDTTGIYVVLDTGGTDHPGRYKISIPDSQRFTIDDSLTLITEVVKPDQLDFDFHVPFDSTGAVYPLIWNMWLENNLEKIFLGGYTPGEQLRGVKMWFGTSPEYDFGNYREQTASWIEWLRRSPLDPRQMEVREYTGYPGNPATSDQYIYDLLRDMLVFHSRCFEEKL